MVETVTKFDESFFEEEERCGFTISKKRKELWAVELDLLNELDRVCKKYNLTYFLGCGTLLGAVRDNHFIPWDDDLDVLMERKDYYELLEHRNEFGDSFIFQAPNIDKHFFHKHIQIRKKNTCFMLKNEMNFAEYDQGIFIDVFPIDGLPDDKTLIEKLIKKKNKYDKMYNAVVCRKKETKISRIIMRNILAVAILIRYGSVGNIYKKYEDTCMQYAQSNPVYYDLLTVHTDINQVAYHRKEWFDGTTEMLFAGKMYPVPVNYEGVLTRFFGKEYMTPMQFPSMHGVYGEIIDTQRSYKEVLHDIANGKDISQLMNKM